MNMSFNVRKKNAKKRRINEWGKSSKINEDPEVNLIVQKLMHSKTSKKIKNLQEEEHKFDVTKIVMKENFDIKFTNIHKSEQPETTFYFLHLLYEATTNAKDNSILL